MQLNNLKGATKSVDQWKQTFKEWISKIKHKARDIYVHRYQTGGGLPFPKVLTDLEEKILYIIGVLVVQGMDVNELGLPFAKRPNKIIASKIRKSQYKKINRDRTHLKLKVAYQKDSEQNYLVMKKFLSSLKYIFSTLQRLLQLVSSIQH